MASQKCGLWPYREALATAIECTAIADSRTTVQKRPNRGKKAITVVAARAYSGHNSGDSQQRTYSNNGKRLAP